MQNEKMTPWQLVDKELRTKKKDWYWLNDKLGTKIQTVNHWEKRGIPAKHYANVEKILEKPPGWITGDVSPFAYPSELTPQAIEMAVLFDMIPAADKIRRAQAFNAATTAIMQSLTAEDGIAPSFLDSGKPSA